MTLVYDVKEKHVFVIVTPRRIRAARTHAVPSMISRGRWWRGFALAIA
jgi:hypothetical protein